MGWISLIHDQKNYYTQTHTYTHTYIYTTSTYMYRSSLIPCAKISWRSPSTLLWLSRPSPSTLTWRNRYSSHMQVYTRLKTCMCTFWCCTFDACIYICMYLCRYIQVSNVYSTTLYRRDKWCKRASKVKPSRISYRDVTSQKNRQYIFLYIYIYIYIYIYNIRTYQRYIYIYIYMYVCIYICVYTHTHTHTHTYTHTHIYVKTMCTLQSQSSSDAGEPTIRGRRYFSDIMKLDSSGNSKDSDRDDSKLTRIRTYHNKLLKLKQQTDKELKSIRKLTVCCCCCLCSSESNRG